MQDIKNLLTNVFKIDEFIDEEGLALAIESSHMYYLNDGQILQRDETECNGVPFVVKGRLRLFKSSENGREMNIYRIEKGQMCLLGALCILTDKPYDFTVASEGETELLVINSSCFRELVDKNWKFSNYILSELSDKLIHTLSLHESIHLTNIDEKLLNYIYEHEKSGLIYKTHSQIADDLGTSRVVISRAIGKLRDQGVVETSRNKIRLIK